LYERIRSSSKEEVVLTEMQRLGFWPADSGQPSVEADLIRRETELTQALQKLGSELHHLQNPVAALRMLRKERLAKAKARRDETRQKRALARFDKAQVWHRRREHEVLYLGAGVSGGLNHAGSDAGKLAGLAMPVLHKAEQLAQAMGITLSELRFLAFERRVSRISHYRRFAMPKKTGGERIISAPMPRLKRAQYWVLDNVLARAPLHQAAHGFVPGRSIVSNAVPHVGQAVVINLDLKDFFPSIGMPRIKGVFAQLGYSEQVATILALLSTEAATDEVRIDGETFFVAHGERALPQGAPSSPALTNILCKRLDARLQACAAKLGFRYTRYADDLTFSGDADARKVAGKLLWRAKQIVIDEGFTPHPDKQHVMRDAQRQMVTGIVVNQKPSLERETLRRFRATLFQVEKDGPEGKQWNGNTNVIDALEGYAQFIRMVDPARGLPLLVRVRAARARWGAAGVEMKLSQSKRSSAFRALSAQGKAPWDGWWQATVAPAPVLEKTAAQLAAEKKARKAAEAPAATVSLTKRAGVATRVATRPAVRPPVASEAPSAQGPAGKPASDNSFRLAIAVQAALVLAFALATQRVLPGICMAVIVFQSAMFRKPRWGWFIFIVLVWGAITLKW
jgi:retron-type reverse transcriptase